MRVLLAVLLVGIAGNAAPWPLGPADRRRPPRTTHRPLGPTTIEFIIRGPEIVIQQDGKRLATTTLTGHLAEQLGKAKGLGNVKWGDGIYGRFGGTSLKGDINRE